jgi:hypothetical protein
MPAFAGTSVATCVTPLSFYRQLSKGHHKEHTAKCVLEARDAGGTKVAHSDGAGTSAIVDRRDDTCTGGALEAFVDEKAALATFPPPLLRPSSLQ